MANGIFGIGLSALNAAQQGLLVSGHNVSNAATPGYTRQQTVQSASGAQATGSGFIGRGVQVDTVKRVYNQLLVSQVAQAKTESAQLDTYFAQMGQIDTLLADPTGRLGLAPALQDFSVACKTLPPVHPTSLPGNPCCPTPRCWYGVSSR